MEKRMMKNNIEKACFNTIETAQYIGLGITKTQEYIRAGVIPSAKLGRRYVVLKSALDKWLEEGGCKVI